MVGAFNANDIQPDFNDIDGATDDLVSATKQAFVRDNSTDLNTKIANFGGFLTSLTTKLGPICAAAESYCNVFADETSAIADRVVGGTDLMERIGLDNLRRVAISEGFANVTDTPLTGSTTIGQLAEPIAARIGELPDGNEKERMTILYNDVYAVHRATILNMDFARRLDIETFLQADEDEAFRAFVNDQTKQFSGVDQGEFDPITTT